MMDISSEQLYIFLFHYENHYWTHCSEFVYLLGYRLIVCPHTLDTNKLISLTVCSLQHHEKE